MPKLSPNMADAELLGHFGRNARYNPSAPADGWVYTIRHPSNSGRTLGAPDTADLFKMFRKAVRSMPTETKPTPRKRKRNAKRVS